MIELFGKCLQAWMKETNRSIAAVTACAELKSKTTVARILQGQYTYQGCVKLYEALSAHTELGEKWQKRFSEALRVEKIGPRQYALFEALDRQLFHPAPQAAPASCAETKENVLILGCPWQETYDFIAQCLARNPAVRIFHCLAAEELYENPPAVAGLLACLTELRYQAVLLKQSDLCTAQISWNVMLRACPAEGAEQIAIRDGDAFSWHAVSGGERPYTAIWSRIQQLSLKPLYKNDHLRNGSDYIRFQQDSYRMEHGRYKTLVKPTPGIQMLPAELVISTFTDFLADNTDPVAASAESIIYYYRKRAENFFDGDTRLILSRQAMTDFIHTGELADQPFACRPFDREKRLTVLRILLEMAQQSQVTILFTQEGLNDHYSFEAYGGFGTLIYPSQTSYNAENEVYRELILPGSAYAELFRQFTDDVVIPRYCGSPQEAQRFLSRLIALLSDG